MKSLIKILTMILIIVMTDNAQVDPAKPAAVDERLNSEEVKLVWVENEVAEIYPVPVNVGYSDVYYNLYENKEPLAVVIAEDIDSRKAAEVFNKQLAKLDYPEITIKNTLPNNFSGKIIINFVDPSDKLKELGDQAYQITFYESDYVEIIIAAASEQGKLYGVVSLAQLVCRVDNEIKIRKADILDYPAFTRRIFNSNPLPYHLTEDLDWMLRYKIESLSFHNKDYSWYGNDEQLKENLDIYKKWKDSNGGVNALLIFNLYAGDYDIEISNEEHLEKLKEFIKYSYTRGVTRFMANADDAAPFKYGEGYILTSENDKKKFTSMAEANCWLMNNLYDWTESNNFDVEFIYCPAFYTYEEMHYGDMELFQDTPWEDDAYGPLKRDLKIIGENMNKNIQVLWTGPYVCTRRITDNDIEDWTNNLQGKVPFLFDNSIFAHLEFTARTMFTAYGNDFPEKFSEKTGGNGIFINGDATGETSRVATMTANAYMWEEERYNPEVSLINAMGKLYGSNNMNLLFRYKDVELELCKTIKQREIWFAADELWKSIRKTRFITEKNPFYYHQNYGRFKALRMQLKYSVPEPEDISEFKNKCLRLAEKRESLLKEIELRSFNRLSYSLQSEMTELPEFNE